MWLASTMPGLRASRSCQRSPWPKFCSAIFHKESPRFTATAWSFAAPFGLKETSGPTGATGSEGLPERQAAAQATREEERTGRPLGVRKVSASPAAGKEQILVEQDRKLADAAASPEASVRRAPAHRREEGGTPRTAEVSATASACGNGERRHRGKRREEAIARRQLQWILPPREELADFSSLPPERDLPA